MIHKSLSVEGLVDDLAEYVARMTSGNQSRVISKDEMYWFKDRALELIKHIEGNLEVPKNRISAFNKARKEAHRIRMPRDHQKWLSEIDATMRVLYDAANWPSLDESDSLIEISGVKVINQSAKSVLETTNMIEEAIEAIMASGVVGSVDSVAGSEVRIIGGSNNRSRVSGMYYWATDRIEVFEVKKYQDQQVRTLIHEWGHRLWRKFLPYHHKAVWERYDAKCHSAGDVEVKPPKPGDEIDVGGNKTVKVARVDDKAIWIDDYRYIRLSSYLKFARGLAGSVLFPSRYAMENHEEHFCEAFSFYCMGNLDDSIRRKFEDIFVD